MQATDTHAHEHGQTGHSHDPHGHHEPGFFSKYIFSETAKYQLVINKANIKVE